MSTPTPDINTNVRLFDLVRQMRAELHEANLITDSEYAWLSGGADMAHCPEGGSPSPRRLEDYDDIKARMYLKRDDLGLYWLHLKAGKNFALINVTPADKCLIVRQVLQEVLALQ